MEESEDLDSWLGQPPERLKEPTPNPIVDTDSDVQLSDHNLTDSDAASPERTDDIMIVREVVREAEDDVVELSSDSEDEDVFEVDSQRAETSNVYVEVSRLMDDYEDYKYLRGHYKVRRVVSEYKNEKFLVKLESGESDLVSTNDLLKLDNGLPALDLFRKHTMTRSRHNTRKPDLPGMVNWSSLQVSSSGESSSEELGRPRRRRGRQASPEVESDIEVISSDNDEQNVSDESEIGGRRSLRQKENKVRRFFQKEAAGLSDGGLDAPSRSRRLPVRSSKKRVKYSEDPPVKDESKPGRRSSRTRTRPSRSMRERQEDDISAYSEEDVGPKVVATKEVFPKLPKDYPFRRRHRPECDTCFQKGDDERKGILVYCQGCTNSHHKVCLGTRSTREHLVTKVAEGYFVLQCRRCIGIAKTKDHTAPHLGHCEECHEPGVFSKPLRTRLTTKQEQQQREDNGGRDPITIVDMSTVNNNTNVMFRCTTCQRGWHMHHLPARQMNMRSNDDDREDEELNKQELAERRFDYYHRGWVCKDCVENQSLIDALVAWRPVDHESYIPGHRVEMMEESKKEYLVKWKSQSYFRTQWMPGSWVWGTSTGSMRAAFMKKDENSLPKMTTKDAIPEEFFRIDIVFQVRYSSIVRNPSMEIDFLRAKEVESAYVKYKGLGYEDAIWEVPPKSSDTDRFKDYQDAYECYVMGLHTNIPPQSSLRRHLSTIRADPKNFQTAMMKKIQPSTITGGQMMAYQVEGLNWLYYRWFQQHNCILADEMGLGKTIQLIAFFATMVQDHKCWPFLVVVPNSTCPNWRREIRKWAPSLRVVTYYGSAHARKLAHDYELFPKTEEEKEKEKKDSKGSRKKGEVKDIHAHIVVASYDSVVEEKTRQSLMRVPWQGLVVDEGQRLKNDKNLIYDSLSKFRFPFKCLLTGTPLQNNARELFNLLQFLDPKISASAMEAKFETLTKENVPELHELIRPFFLRRTKAQVLTFLPPMAQIILPVTMSTVQKKVYKSILAKNPQLMKSIFTRDAPVAMKEKTNLNNILMQLRKTLCHPFVYSRQIEERSQETNVSHRNLVEASSKLQLLQIMLPKLQERGHRVLIFSQFLDNLDIIEDFLDGLGLQYRRLDGSMSSLEKQKRIDEFNAPDSPYFAFLLSTRSGGVGINLATADTVLIIDPDFNPHQDIQALSRAHRIGQKKKVLCFQIMTRGSAEEKIMQIGKKKMALDHVMIQEMDREDEAGMDLESILRHGAEALFDDDNTGDIVYDSASVDKLLDRSQIESTNTGNDSSAESQFSFARIWANDKASLEDTLEDSGTSTPNPGIWDKILKERERAYAEESARNKEAFGRGKRKRHTVDYHDQDGADPDFSSPAKNVQKQASGSASDTDFQAPLEESEDEMSGVEDTEFNPRNEVEVRPQPGPNTPPTAPKVVQPMMKGRQFARVKVPTGLAPNFNNDGAADYIHFGDLPPFHNCSACHEKHPMGWCRLKIAGVEHCNLCGLSHLGHEETCPHLKSEVQIGILLRQLKESTESKELVDKATAHLKAIKAELVKKKVAAEVQRVSAGIGTVNRAAAGLNGNVDRRSVHAMQMHTADWRRRDLLGSNTSSQVGNDVNGTSSSIRGSTQH